MSRNAILTLLNFSCACAILFGNLGTSINFILLGVQMVTILIHYKEIWK
jgi:hypothetical protein